ncbi:MAG: hypothetical protein ABL959_03465 [Pyrinomonadaceae bacterium]
MKHVWMKGLARRMPEKVVPDQNLWYKNYHNFQFRSPALSQPQTSSV